MNIFFHSPVRIVECVSEYIFLIKITTTTTTTTKNKKTKAKEIKEKKISKKTKGIA